MKTNNFGLETVLLLITEIVITFILTKFLLYLKKIIENHIKNN